MSLDVIILLICPAPIQKRLQVFLNLCYLLFQHGLFLYVLDDLVLVPLIEVVADDVVEHLEVLDYSLFVWRDVINVESGF